MDFLEANLPTRDTELFATECLTDLVATFNGCAKVVNMEACSEKDLEFLFWLYDEVPHFPETVILIGDCKPGLGNSKFLRYQTFQDLETDLKYVLLDARRKKKASDNFSNSLANALRILKLVAEKPGISSKEIAEKLEIAPRSVTRYIETLNIAGESIVYDRKTNGWSLEFGESFLMKGI